MEDKPTTVRESKTVVHVVTKTVAKVVEKPYIPPTYVIKVTAILAAYLIRRSKPTAQR